MTLAEKLKSIRKQMGMSQEQLANKLHVSRQAITKWEKGAGIPDIENIMAISALFDISIDELLLNEKGDRKSNDYLFESVMEYDIDEPKRFDLKFSGAKQCVLTGYDKEKIRVRLASNTLSSLQTDFKIKIDDIKKRLDVEVIRKNGVTEASAKEAISIFVQLPVAYLDKIECTVNAETVKMHSLKCESIELDVKASNIVLEEVEGTVEINGNLDMSIGCSTLSGSVEINQIAAASKIYIPEGVPFAAIANGIKTAIYFEKDGKSVEAFDDPDAKNTIKLNGMKSELIISTLKKEGQPS